MRSAKCLAGRCAKYVAVCRRDRNARSSIELYALYYFKVVAAALYLSEKWIYVFNSNRISGLPTLRCFVRLYIV